MIALRLQRIAQASPGLGVGELEIRPRAALLGGTAVVARAQAAQSFGLQQRDARPPVGEERSDIGIERRGRRVSRRDCRRVAIGRGGCRRSRR